MALLVLVQVLVVSSVFGVASWGAMYSKNRGPYIHLWSWLCYWSSTCGAGDVSGVLGPGPHISISLWSTPLWSEWSQCRHCGVVCQAPLLYWWHHHDVIIGCFWSRDCHVTSHVMYHVICHVICHMWSCDLDYVIRVSKIEEKFGRLGSLCHNGQADAAGEGAQTPRKPDYWWYYGKKSGDLLVCLCSFNLPNCHDPMQNGIPARFRSFWTVLRLSPALGLACIAQAGPGPGHI